MPAQENRTGISLSAFLHYCVIDFTASPTLKPNRLPNGARLSQIVSTP
jgi:hypothetical protein